MDNENKVLLDVDAGESIKTIKDLRSEIAQLRKNLDNCAVGSEEAAKASEQLSSAQDELRQALKGNTTIIERQAGSYNDLQYQMSKMREEWKNTTDLARKQELTKEIVKIQDNLKGQDESIHQYFRNVGNYTNSIVDAFNKVGLNIGNINPMFAQLANNMVSSASKGEGALAGLKSGVSALGTQLKALLLNPVGAAIMAVVVVAKMLSDAFKRDEEAMTGLQKIAAPFKAVWQSIQRLFDDMVDSIKSIMGPLNAVNNSISVFSLLLKPLKTLIAGMRVQLAVLSTVFTDVAKGIRWCADAVGGLFNKFKESKMGKWLGGIVDQVKGFAEQIANLIESAANSTIGKTLGLDTLYTQLKSIAGTSKELTQANKEIADEELRLTKLKRENQKLTADEAVKLQELRNQYKLASNDVEKQKKLSEEIGEIERNQKRRTYNELVAEYNLIKKKNSLTKSGTEDLNAESEAYAAMKKAEADMIALTQEETSVQKKLNKEVKEGSDTKKETVSEEEKKLDILMKQLYEWKKKNFEDNATLEQSLAQLKIFYEENLVLLGDNEEAKKILEQKYLEDIKALREKFNKEELDTIGKLYDAEKKLIDQSYDISQFNLEEQLRKTGDAYTYRLKLIKLNIATTKEEIELSNTYLDQLEKERLKLIENGDSTIDIDNKITDAKTANTKLRMQLTRQEYDLQNEEIDVLNDKITSVTDSMASFASKISGIGKGISSEWANVFSSMSAGMEQVSTSLKKNGKGWQSYGKMATASLETATSLMSALADQQDAKTEEGFRKQKGMQIASATMAMLSGIVSAMTNSIRDLGVPAGPIVGAALSSMVAGLGAAQIASIAKQTLDSASTVTSNVSSAATSALSAPVQYTSSVEGSSIQSAIGNQKVYVTETDISSTANKVKVIQSENRY